MKNIYSSSVYSSSVVYVSKTGEHKSMYTAYRYHVTGVDGVWCNESYAFQKALSKNKDIAIKKAEKISKTISSSAGVGKVPVVFEDDESKELFNSMDAFGLCWYLAKNSDCFYALPDEPFWDLWHKDKQKLKAWGFWVYKINKEFLVFFKPIFRGRKKRLTKQDY